ncbi:hypothetical protein GCM10022379_13320 [Micromonospora maritima]
MRVIYEHMNAYIHAGSLDATLAVDFSNPDLVSTRRQFDYQSAAFALRAATLLLDTLSFVACRTLFRGNWDEMLVMGPIRSRVQAIDELLPADR